MKKRYLLFLIVIVYPYLIYTLWLRMNVYQLPDKFDIILFLLFLLIIPVIFITLMITSHPYRYFIRHPLIYNKQWLYSIFLGIILCATSLTFLWLDYESNGRFNPIGNIEFGFPIPWITSGNFIPCGNKTFIYTHNILDLYTCEESLTKELKIKPLLFPINFLYHLSVGTFLVYASGKINEGQININTHGNVG